MATVTEVYPGTRLYRPIATAKRRGGPSANGPSACIAEQDVGTGTSGTKRLEHIRRRIDAGQYDRGEYLDFVIARILADWA